MCNNVVVVVVVVLSDSVEVVDALLALALLPHGHVTGVVRDGERDAAADLLHAAPQLRLDRVPRRRLREDF